MVDSGSGNCMPSMGMMCRLGLPANEAGRWRREASRSGAITCSPRWSNVINTLCPSKPEAPVRSIILHHRLSISLFDIHGIADLLLVLQVVGQLHAVPALRSAYQLGGLYRRSGILAFCLHCRFVLIFSGKSWRKITKKGRNPSLCPSIITLQKLPHYTVLFVLMKCPSCITIGKCFLHGCKDTTSRT